MSTSGSILRNDIWDFTRDSHHEATGSNVQLHYERAKQLCLASGLTVDDIRHLTPQFWRFNADMISTRDPTAFTIATIHLNLCIGTIARFLDAQSDLGGILNDLMEFKICGEFMLTEIGHGLDARNLETTATRLQDGCFVLKTPSFSAAKSMPPTTPLASVPRLAVVFARLLVQGEDRGVKPFMVPINDAHQMCPGVTSRALPVRPGTKPLDHAITTFSNVKLAAGALLGSTSKAQDERADFLDQIWRVSVGTLALSMSSISALKLAGSIAAINSQRRHVAIGRGTQTIPVINFSTQSRPVLKALAHAEVLDAFALWAVQEFMVFVSLASEMLMGKYRLPEPEDHKSHFAKYERGLFNELNQKATSLSGSHRGEGFNTGILPHCRIMVEAIGQRMAFEAARASEAMCPEILDVFLMSCIREDPTWYIEQGHFTRAQIWQDEEKAYGRLHHLLPKLVERTGAKAYITAPMIGQDNLQEFFLGLPTFGLDNDIVKSSWEARL